MLAVSQRLDVAAANDLCRSPPARELQFEPVAFLVAEWPDRQPTSAQECPTIAAGEVWRMSTDAGSGELSGNCLGNRASKAGMIADSRPFASLRGNMPPWSLLGPRLGASDRRCP